MTANKQAKGDRSNYYATILYPESAPDDWAEVLNATHIPVLISPIHDRDKDKEGNLKKPHHHVILLYSSLKSEKQAREVFGLIGGVGCEKVHDIAGMTRYLTHASDPDKAQYRQEDVIALNGADYMKYLNDGKDLTDLYIDALQWIRQNECISFEEFTNYALDNHPEWLKLGHRGTAGSNIRAYQYQMQKRLLNERKYEGETNR